MLIKKALKLFNNMVLNFENSVLNVYLYEELLQIGNTINVNIYLKNQLSNSYLTINNLNYLTGVITQKDGWINININKPNVDYSELDISGYYYISLEYNSIVNENLWLIKVENPLYKNHIDSIYQGGQKTYKTYNG